MQPLTYILIGLVLIFVLYGIGSVVYREFVIEKPAYEAIEKKDGYEIRKYNPYVTASYTGPGDINNGFMNVAGYIFGGNISSEKIAMTSPVITNERGSNQTTSFILPSSYSLDSLPTPTNSEVTINEVPSKVWAVKTFSGNRPSIETEQEYLADLVRRLEQDAVSYTTTYQFAYYDPPTTLPFLKRNEVWVELEDME